MDDFFHAWVELHGEERVTNYAHMLGTGHMMEYEYLLHWQSLHYHSQQEWEGK